MELSNGLSFLANAAKYQEMVLAYQHQSAKLKCLCKKGVMYGDYSGLLTRDAALLLGSNLQRLAGARPTFERLHHAVTMPFNQPPSIEHLIGSRPGCWIVRPDQYAMMVGFSEVLAASGVVRLTFLESQAHHARHWLTQFD